MSDRHLAILAALVSPLFTVGLWVWILAHRAAGPDGPAPANGGHYFPAAFLVWLVCAMTCGLLGTSVPKNEQEVFSGRLRLFLSLGIAAGLAMAFGTMAIH
jgi:hypothetical protein